MNHYQVDKQLSVFYNQLNASQNAIVGMCQYTNDFILPYLIAANYLSQVESKKSLTAQPSETFQSYMDLLEFNMDIFRRSMIGSMQAISNFNQAETYRIPDALYNTVFGQDGEDLASFMAKHAKMVETLVYEYPKAINAIEPEFGFHFEKNINLKIAETDRFILYQIKPTDKQVTIKENGKPILIVPPFVLGANILGFLPNDNRSYAHCYANQGIPTYIRIMKDIATNPAVQIMNGDNDVKDTKYFCETMKLRHGKPVTLNGYCQGGFSVICDYLTGELDGLVDAILTCVSPMDGTRSKGFCQFLQGLPIRFNHLDYGTKRLPNGNIVADGKLMGWVYKLKAIENEFPLVAFLRDLQMFRPNENNEVKIGKSPAAINYWITHERYDLPLEITKMSFASYNTPITDDGTLPVKLLGRKLNLNRIKEKNITWLICYGESDDLVEKDTALAPADFVNVEVSPFPRGHVAIATSWSNPKSEYALHKRYDNNKYRGPVRFQLDLDENLDKTAANA